MPDIKMKSTKELARELGLLRKRTSSAGSQYLKRIKKNKQGFAYLIVIDFESTCWQNVKYKTQEIIEFPAVLLNTVTGAIDAEFHHYVQPQEHPYLSDFCRELTGITQEQVDQGIPLSLTIKRFSSWLQQLSSDRNISYDAFSSHETKCTFVTWSDWDLGVCLQYETRRKQIRKPAELNTWIDLRATYRNFYQRRPQGLNGALQDLGITFEGREHSGLCDARNTAKLAWRMMTDGCQLQVTKTLTPALTGGTGPKRTIPSAVIAPQGQTSLPSDKREQPSAQESSTSNCPQTTDAKADDRAGTAKKLTIGPPKAFIPNHSRAPTICNPVASLDDSTKPVNVQPILNQEENDHSNDADDRANQKAQHSNPPPVIATATASAHNSHLMRPNSVRVVTSTSKTCQDKTTPKAMNQGCSFKIYCDTKTGNATASKTETKSCGTFKIPSPVGMINTRVSGPFKTPSPVSGGRVVPPNAVSSSTDRRALKNTTNTTTPLYTSALNKTTPGNTTANYRTPNTSGSLCAPSSSGMKRTPPMCECGRRTHRKLVQSPGPNQGRAFYCCPSGRRKASSPFDNITKGFGGSKKQGCAFFKWETANKDPMTSMTGSFMRTGSSSRGQSVVRTRSYVVPPLPQPNFNTPQSEQRIVTRKALGTGPAPSIGPLRY